MNQDFLTAATNFHDHCAGLPTKRFSLKTFEVESVEELKVYAETLLRTKNNLQLQGVTVAMKGIGERAVWLSHEGLTLRVQVTAKVKRPQAVTETSRDAYKTVEIGDKCEAVARAALKLGVCTDNEVAREIGMPANLVSGRRNNIEDAGGITIDGVLYVVKMAGVAKRDEVTKRSGNVWFLEEVVKIEKVEPSPESPKQTELF